MWIEQLQLSLDLRMDALSWVLALIVTGVGSLVLLYCASYFRDDEPGLGRFAAVLLAFAGTMYGLVLADDVYLLFVLWEATSVFSYLLIGHYTHRKASRGAALQALITTTFGGLVMLVGLVLLAVQAGTSNLTTILAELPAGPLTTTAIMLVLVGALSKSAIVPLHFWLPGAMAAPTPVSAYLHAAAMVKAALPLLRASPEEVWSEVTARTPGEVVRYLKRRLVHHDKLEAVFVPALKSLLLADLHLGKGDAFRRAGLTRLLPADLRRLEPQCPTVSPCW